MAPAAQVTTRLIATAPTSSRTQDWTAYRKDILCA